MFVILRRYSSVVIPGRTVDKFFWRGIGQSGASHSRKRTLTFGLILTLSGLTGHSRLRSQFVNDARTVCFLLS